VHLPQLQPTPHKPGQSPQRRQKQEQRDLDGLIALHDIVLLWLWLEPKMEKEFTGTVMDSHRDLFMKG